MVEMVAARRPRTGRFRSDHLSRRRGRGDHARAGRGDLARLQRAFAAAARGFCLAPGRGMADARSRRRAEPYRSSGQTPSVPGGTPPARNFAERAMNACLNEKELTRLFVSDAAEMPAARAHVAECAACASRYEELARDARIIAGTIASAAASRATLQEYTAKRAVDGWRSDRPYARVAGWFAGATAFGAAAAIATMLALGWRP